MEKIPGASGTCQGPIVLLTPLVSPHYEDLDRFLFREIILDSFEEILIPAQSDFVFVPLFGGRAKIDLADFPPITGVSTNNHQQSLSRPRCLSSTRSDAAVIAERSSLKNVIPGGHGQSGDVNVGVVLFDRPALPVLVVIGMSQPVEKIRSQCMGGVKPRR